MQPGGGARSIARERRRLRTRATCAAFAARSRQRLRPRIRQLRWTVAVRAQPERKLLARAALLRWVAGRLWSRRPCGSPSAAAHLLAEAVLEAARQLLLVAHAAGAAVLPANHLRAPVVMPVARRRVAAGAAHLLLKVERGAAAAAAGRVRLLDLHLVGLLGVRHGWRRLTFLGIERASTSRLEEGGLEEKSLPKTTELSFPRVPRVLERGYVSTNV